MGGRPAASDDIGTPAAWFDVCIAPARANSSGGQNSELVQPPVASRGDSLFHMGGLNDTRAVARATCVVSLLHKMPSGTALSILRLQRVAQLLRRAATASQTVHHSVFLPCGFGQDSNSMRLMALATCVASLRGWWTCSASMANKARSARSAHSSDVAGRIRKWATMNISMNSCRNCQHQFRSFLLDRKTDFSTTKPV